MKIKLKINRDELKKKLDIKDGKPGKDYELTDKDKKQIADSIEVPIVEKIVEKTEIIKETPNSDTPQALREKLESLEGDERLDKSAIKGLAEALKAVGKIRTVVFGGARNAVEYTDLSSKLNGTLKTFTVPRRRYILLVASFFPYVLRPTTDYTGDGTVTLTLTSEIPAPPAGQTLILLHSRV